MQRENNGPGEFDYVWALAADAPSVAWRSAQHDGSTEVA